MANTTVNLGMLPQNRGEYSSSATYYKDNIVQYNGSSYICTAAMDLEHPSGITGVAPYDSDPATPNTGWAVFSNDSSGVGEGVYNVSVDHTTDNQPKVYANLSAALNDIPAAKQKGGMSIKFIQGTVQNSDHKYVQYMYGGTAVTGTPNPFLDVANWEKINLEKEVKELNSDIEDIAVNICSDITAEFNSTISDSYVKNTGEIKTASGWTTRIYNITADKKLFLKRTNAAVYAAVFDSLPVLDAQGTVLFTTQPLTEYISVDVSNGQYLAIGYITENYKATVLDGSEVINVREEFDGLDGRVDALELQQAKTSDDIDDINETLTKNLSKDVSDDYDSVLDNLNINLYGTVQTANSWKLYVYKFDEDKTLYVKRTNKAICGAIFNSSPALSDQGTVVFNNSTEESEFIFTLPANKYFAAARLNANYTYSISTDTVDIKELSDSVTTLQSDVYSLEDDVADVENDILDIRGVGFSGNVTAGTALTYGTYYAPLEKKSGDSFTLEITEGLNLLGTGTIFVYVKRKSDNSWRAPGVFTNGKWTSTLTFDITAFSIATAANNVIGTGEIKVEYVSELTPIRQDLSALNTDVSNIEQGSVNGITNYNNIPFNQTSIADFLVKYKKQDVDAFNQLNVTLAGDSIFGRMYGTELPYTPDMNDTEETSLGYQTGHFPPNMWCQNVPYNVLQYLQYKHSDVKYYNNIASEVVKTGTWSDNHNNTDGVYLCYTETSGDTIKLSFSGATHLKFIWSDYLTPTSRGAQIKVSFSDDNGSTWKSPSDLSLVEKIASDDNNGNGIYSLDYTEKFKFGNNIWKGFNKNASYICKIELLNSHRLNVWGFETWSNPRINVIVTAQGGNTANDQLNNPSRFYSWMYGQDLVIYELPFLNDLGIGVITSTYYKGVITTNSSAPAFPSEDQFYYCSEEGVYTNFGGLYAYKGDYISYKNSSWVIGSDFLDGVIDNYIDKNSKVFAFLSKMGVPLLTLTTHGSNNAESLRPFTNEVGLPLLRGLVKEYGFANIDVYAYHKFVLGGADIWSDGTHLDSNGVAMYLTLIKSVVTLENNLLASAFAKVGWKSLVGESSDDSVDFGFEFKEIPNVEVYNSTSRVVTDITSKGFTTTGSGSYKYRVSID